MVEHLDDATLKAALASMHAMLKPGGRLVVTTPNEEDLSREWVLCPETGHVMHRWQHMRSWSAATLAQSLTAAGFQVDRTYACQAHALGPSLRDRAQRLSLVALRRKPPNLFAIATKRA